MDKLKLSKLKREQTQKRLSLEKDTETYQNLENKLRRVRTQLQENRENPEISVKASH